MYNGGESKDAKLCLSYLASSSHAREARARVNECRQSHARAPNSLPRTPLSHLMEFATLIDFYDFERTDAEPHEGVVSTSGIYRQERGPSLKMGIYGRDGKPSLTCQRATPATMAPYRGASRYLRCGVRLQEEHGRLQAAGSKEEPGSKGPGSNKLKNSN